MFPMTDTVRTMLHHNTEIAQKMFRFGFDLQAQSVKLGNDQVERNLTAFNEAFEVSLKANRAMQEAVTNGMLSQLQAPAKAA